MAAFGAFERSSESTSCHRAVGMTINHCNSKLNHHDSVNQRPQQQQSNAMTASITDCNSIQRPWQATINDRDSHHSNKQRCNRDSNHLWQHNLQQSTSNNCDSNNNRNSNNQRPKQQQSVTKTATINDRNSNNQRPWLQWQHKPMMQLRQPPCATAPTSTINKQQLWQQNINHMRQQNQWPRSKN